MYLLLSKSNVNTYKLNHLQLAFWTSEIKYPFFFKNRSDPEDTKHQTSPVQTSDNVSTDSGISTDSGDFPESEQDTELFYEKPKHLNQ